MSDISILLVEDEPVVSMDIAKRLELLGYPRPTIVKTGKEAIETAASLTPGLILMDIVLAGDMDGIDAAAHIQKHHRVPIIYLTGHADAETLQRAKITEPFGYILKPFEDRELHTCIEMGLYKHKTEHKIRRNEEWFATTLSNIGDAVFTVNKHGHITLMNNQAEELTGIDSREALGMVLTSVIQLHDETSGLSVSMQHALSKKMPYATAAPATLITPAGASIPVDLKVSLIGQRGEDPTGAVFVLRDATERKQSEAALLSSLDNLRRTFGQTVNALAITSEKRDPYTAGHQVRVSSLACAIAKEMCLPPEQIEAIRVAGKLHDIGKIYIPAEILAKPARLSDLEMSLIKTHPSVGHEILQSIDFPWPVADIVHQHHERYDGNGYPNKLAQEDIMLEARILCVADVVEAMSSHRPYRPSLGLALALEEVSAGKGSHFDPTVADACLALFNKGYVLE